LPTPGLHCYAVTPCWENTAGAPIGKGCNREVGEGFLDADDQSHVASLYAVSDPAKIF